MISSEVVEVSGFGVYMFVVGVLLLVLWIVEILAFFFILNFASDVASDRQTDLGYLPKYVEVFAAVLFFVCWAVSIWVGVLLTQDFFGDL